MLSKKPRKKSKQEKRKALVKKLDKTFSQVVRSIGECEKCGKRITLQCCHINSRRFYHTRWDQLNALCLCAGCHFWSHQHPRLFTKFVNEYYGEGTLDEIDKKSQLITTITLEEMEEIYNNLKIQLDGFCEE